MGETKLIIVITVNSLELFLEQVGVSEKFGYWINLDMFIIVYGKW